MKNRLRMLRVERNWSQSDLANRLGVSRQTVNALEMGKYDPSLPLALKIAHLFSWPIESIFSCEPLETNNRESMFERFTQKAVTVITLAQQEAHRMGHNFVGTEQILLGLIAEDTGLAAKVLKTVGVQLEDARLEVENIIGRGNGVIEMEIPFTPKGKLVLDHASEESRRIGHTYVGTEHLLLGVLRVTDGVAVKVLANLGVNLHEVAKLAVQEAWLLENDSATTLSSSNSSLNNEDIPTESPPDFISGEVSTRFCAHLFAWVEPRQLGYVLSSQVGYQLTNGEILQPHCSFVSRQKLKRMPRTYPEVPPDLIMEIKSAFDRLLSVQNKVQSFLKWGTRIGILIDPDRHTVSVYRPDTTVTILEEGETLVLPEILPDWELPVSELWTPSPS